jgi:hypothetical protein
VKALFTQAPRRFADLSGKENVSGKPAALPSFDGMAPTPYAGLPAKDSTCYTGDESNFLGDALFSYLFQIDAGP